MKFYKVKSEESMHGFMCDTWEESEPIKIGFKDCFKAWVMFAVLSLIILYCFEFCFSISHGILFNACVAALGSLLVTPIAAWLQKNHLENMED